jgi:hypothetical protein
MLKKEGLACLSGQVTRLFNSLLVVNVIVVECFGVWQNKKYDMK